MFTRLSCLSKLKFEFIFVEIFQAQMKLNLDILIVYTVNPCILAHGIVKKKQLSTQLLKQPYVIDKQMYIFLDRAHFFLSEFILSFLLSWVVFELFDSKVIPYY